MNAKKSARQAERLDHMALVAWARAGAEAGWVFGPPPGPGCPEPRVALDGDQRIALSLLHHSRNGGMSKAENGRARGMGTVRGWPDLFLPLPVSYLEGDRLTGYCPGLFIELKAPGGRPTRDQIAVHNNLEFLGYRVEVCRGYDEGRRVILEYLQL